MNKKILIIFTGGTIAGNVASSKVSKTTKSSSNSFTDIVDNSASIIKHNWNIEITYEISELYNIDSSNVTPAHWHMITEEIQKKYDDFDAFLVMHGTNTMGYTAAALSFALENINKPVILTGAQVPLGYLGSDATMNLVNALRLCVWGYHPIKGVMAVFGSKIITGTRVKKGTDYDYDPFRSFITGTIGQIGRYIRLDEKALEKHNSYLSKKMPLAIQARALSVKSRFETESIAVLSEFPGMSAELFSSLVESNNIKGFILRAFGAGDPNKNLFPGFEYLKEKKIPIIVTTQAPSGISNFQVNETGQYLREHDLAIPAHDMSMESMVTKLSWLIAYGKLYEEIKGQMVEDLHGEINIEPELI